VIDGKERIGSKFSYHSELADGHPSEASGEIGLKRNPTGFINAVLVNDFSGHYRISGSEFKMGNIITHALDDDHSPAPNRPGVFFTHDSLTQHLGG
jgi:hypothetical protein